MNVHPHQATSLTQYQADRWWKHFLLLPQESQLPNNSQQLEKDQQNQGQRI